MKKVYLAHPISTTGEFNDSIRVAKRIEWLDESGYCYLGDVEGLEINGAAYEFEGEMKAFVGAPKFEVYAPALNKEINDKSNNPTPAMIYEQDVDNLLSSDIVVVNYTGGDSDGTVLELGMLAGMHESKSADLPTVLVYSSNKRALQPQLHHGVASGKLNHMVLGAIDRHFKWCGDEEGLILELQKMSENEDAEECGRGRNEITRDIITHALREYNASDKE